MRWPGEPTGSDPFSAWCRALVRKCRAAEIVSVSGGLLKEGSSAGKTLDIPSVRGGGGVVRQFRLVSIQNDFYSCVRWDGTTAGEEEVYIARPFEHRYSNFHGQVIAYSSDGDVFNASFSYTSATKRTKTINGTAEEQVLTPLFKSDFTIIYAMECSETITVGPSNTPLTDPNDAPITLLDLNLDGRAWTKN